MLVLFLSSFHLHTEWEGFCLMVLNISGFFGLNVDANGITFSSVFSLTTRKFSLFIFMVFSMPLSIIFIGYF